MIKLILFSLLLVGNLALAAASMDDQLGSFTAAKGPGEKQCKCDDRAASNEPVSTSPAEVQKHNKAQVATVYSKDDPAGGSGNTHTAKEPSGT